MIHYIMIEKAFKKNRLFFILIFAKKLNDIFWDVDNNVT